LLLLRQDKCGRENEIVVKRNFHIKALSADNR